MKNSLNLEFTEEKNGMGTLIVTLESTTIFADRLAIAEENARNLVVERLCSKYPGLQASTLNDRLLELVRVKKTNGTAPSSQSVLLLEIVQDVQFFHTPGMPGEAYAVIPAGSHKQTWPLSSPTFKHWLQGRYWKAHHTAINSQSMQDALGVMNNKAIHDGPEFPIAVRLARVNDDVYLDLCDAEWRSVHITPEGWEVISNPPVRFVRRNGMKSLPIPERGGSIQDLRQLVNIQEDNDFLLVLSWLLSAASGKGPYPILVVDGLKGSAKSCLCRILRDILDPNEAGLRSEPRQINDLMIAANNALILAYDNLSSVSQQMSDALCRLSTGGGFGTRELYSDGNEKLFNAQRPILFNGIDQLARREDLLDRCICITLPEIPASKRITEGELWSRFEAMRPKLLGSLLDTLSATIRRLPLVDLREMPRMADFTRLAVAAEQVMGFSPGAFLTAYSNNRNRSCESAIEASEFCCEIPALMSNLSEWNGTVMQLLEELLKASSDHNCFRRLDPRSSSKRFALELRRLKPDFREMGLDVIFQQRSNSGRRLILRRIDEKSTSPYTPDANVSGDSWDEPTAGGVIDDELRFKHA